MLGGCSENGNNPVEGISSFEAGISSSEPDIESSSSEEIYLSSSSENDPFSSSFGENYLSSSEDRLSSSSGVDYTNWVMKKSIYWDCDDSLCNEKRKSSEIDYNYISYTDPEHYTVVEIDISPSFSRNYIIIRNGLNYSGTRTLTQYTSDLLTLSYKRETTFSEERHPIVIFFYTYQEETGQAITYTSGEISKIEPINSVLTDTFLDLEIIEGLSCYKHIPGNISAFDHSIRCYDENDVEVKYEFYSNDTLTYKSIKKNVQVLNSGEFVMWTGITESYHLQDGIWVQSGSRVSEIIEKTEEKIVIWQKIYVGTTNSELNSISEIHYGPAI